MPDIYSPSTATNRTCTGPVRKGINSGWSRTQEMSRTAIENNFEVIAVALDEWNQILPHLIPFSKLEKDLSGFWVVASQKSL